MENNMKNPFNLAEDNCYKEKELTNPFMRKKSRIVLNEINANAKKSKNYAMEFENLYDKFERDIDFDERISNPNKILQKSESPNTNKNLKNYKRSPSLIIPFGSVNKSEKKEIAYDFLLSENFNFFNDDNICPNENQEFLIKRKSSILGKLESNVIKKRNSNI